MVGLWGKLRLVKASVKYSGDFCEGCRKKFRDIVSLEGDNTLRSVFDEVCVDCKPVVDKIVKEFDRGLLR